MNLRGIKHVGGRIKQIIVALKNIILPLNPEEVTGVEAIIYIIYAIFLSVSCVSIFSLIALLFKVTTGIRTGYIVSDVTVEVVPSLILWIIVWMVFRRLIINFDKLKNKLKNRKTKKVKMNLRGIKHADARIKKQIIVALKNVALKKPKELTGVAAIIYKILVVIVGASSFLSITFLFKATTGIYIRFPFGGIPVEKLPLVIPSLIFIWTVLYLIFYLINNFDKLKKKLKNRK